MAQVVMVSTEAAVHALMALNGLDWQIANQKPMYPPPLSLSGCAGLGPGSRTGGETGLAGCVRIVALRLIAGFFCQWRLADRTLLRAPWMAHALSLLPVGSRTALVWFAPKHEPNRKS